jgi:hypothetical protein
MNSATALMTSHNTMNYVVTLKVYSVRGEGTQQHHHLAPVTEPMGQWD